MFDIFISYSRVDKAWVEILAKALGREGYKVWWDIEILAGEDFEATIQKALKSSKCVITVWSEASISSQWVKEESSRALESKKIIPILYQAVKLPMPFGRIHTEDFVGWKGSVIDSKYKRLLKSVNSHVRLNSTHKEKVTTNFSIVPIKRYLFSAAIFIVVALSGYFLIKYQFEENILLIKKKSCLNNSNINVENNLDYQVHKVKSGEYKIGKMLDEYNDTRRVVFIKGFNIDKFEVTNYQYKNYLNKLPIEETTKDLPSNWKESSYPYGRESYPVTEVSWESSNRYCKSIGKRLPSADEWEVTCLYANSKESHNSCHYLNTVGESLKGINVFNINNNISEWTSEMIKNKAHLARSNGNIFKHKAIVKGSNYVHNNYSCSDSLSKDINYSYKTVGFRCAL